METTLIIQIVISVSKLIVLLALAKGCFDPNPRSSFMYLLGMCAFTILILITK